MMTGIFCALSKKARRRFRSAMAGKCYNQLN